MPGKGSVAGLFLAGGGALLIWSAIKGKKWSAALKEVIAGQSPAEAAANPITGTTAPVLDAGGTGAPPVLPAGGLYGTAQLRSLWMLAGGSAGSSANAACHAMQESSGDPGVTSTNPDGGTNVGLWQLDTKGVGAGYTVQQLKNPVTNAKITVRATDDGANWSDWATPGC
jgi:hypothetical protein